MIKTMNDCLSHVDSRKLAWTLRPPTQPSQSLYCPMLDVSLPFPEPRFPYPQRSFLSDVWPAHSCRSHYVYITALFLVVRGPLLQIWLGHPWSPFYSTQEASWNGEPVAQVSRFYPLPSTMNPLLNMRGLKWSCHIQEMGTDFFLNLLLGCSFVQLQGHQ